MSLVETTETTGRALTFGEQLKTRQSQFVAALPAHIPVERFLRVVMTAIQNNPQLARADQQSLWNSAMRAAQDGLLPDGREGAFVIYNSKEKGDDGKDYWIKKVQWLPMIAGIRKKVRNSGEIANWEAQVVHAKDHFEFELGDEPYIKHKPSMEEDPGPVIAAYSVAVLKSGEKSREVMTRAQLDKVRAASKSPNSGPWESWFEEMCRKSVAKRHSKVLPMSTDLDDLMRRDEDLYDMGGARVEGKAATERVRLSLSDKLDRLAKGTGAPTEAQSRDATPAHDAETGEIIEPRSPQGEQVTTGAEHDGSAQSEQHSSDNAASSPKDAEPAESSPAVSASGAAESPAQQPPLLETARARAMEGKRALTRWRVRLTVSENDSLRPHDKLLNDAAEAADREAAKAG